MTNPVKKNQTIQLPPIVRLKYQEGDLIVREGDYGNAIYVVSQGQVRVYFNLGEDEITLTTLGPGEIFGETSFFNRSFDPHMISARAEKDAVLEVWHVARLAKEHDSMTPVFKYLFGQSMTHLFRTRKLMRQFASKRASQNVNSVAKRKEWAGQKRRHYRKPTSLACFYRPVNGPASVKLTGRIMNLSREGAGIEVGGAAIYKYSHEVGDEFHIDTTLPNSKPLSFTGKVVNLRKAPAGGRYLGIYISDITYINQQNLGFFLMP